MIVLLDVSLLYVIIWWSLHAEGSVEVQIVEAQLSDLNSCSSNKSDKSPPKKKRVVL
jgi:hypothetical protein